MRAVDDQAGSYRASQHVRDSCAGASNATARRRNGGEIDG
jgi:hypothetical protein